MWHINICKHVKTDLSGWVFLAMILLLGPMRCFQWDIASSRARTMAIVGPELMKAVNLGKWGVPYWSA